MQVGLPARVPALRAENIFRLGWKQGNHKRCLYAWQDSAFENPDAYATFGARLDEAALRAGAEDAYVFARLHPEAETAALWNDTVEGMGYVRRGNAFYLSQ